MHRRNHRKPVVQVDVDLRTLRYANKRAWILQRPARLAESIDSENPTVLVLRMPLPLAKLERETEHAFTELTCRRTIIVCNDREWAIGGT